MLKLSLRIKLLFGAVVILTPLLILLVLNYKAAFDTRRDQVLSDQLSVAQVVSVIVNDSFDEALSLARSYATDPVILSFDRERINDYLERLVPIYPEYDSAVALFDTNGILIASARRTEPISVADREWFQEVMLTQKPIISNVVISRGSGRPIVVAAAPVFDPDGKLAGTVSSALSIDHFPESLAAVERAPGQHIFLADRTGRLAFYTAKPELAWEERDLSAYPPVRTALEGKLFIGEATDSLLGDRRMVVTTPTPTYGWVVGVSMPVDVALAPVQQSLRNALMIFAIVVVLSLGLALGLAELLARPLKQLTEHAVALGRGELQRRVKITTGDELERLGDSFNAMADEVQRALRLREEFLSVASHELRTPLTVIRGYSQWLLTKETDAEKRRVLQIIVRQASRISELLDEMLTMSEIKAGRVQLHPERFDLSSAAREVVDRMQMITEKHRLLFFGEQPIMVEADRNQIEVVLTNLIDNAVRYSPVGGDIELSVSRRDSEALVSVRDRGMGIAPEKQRHVFEPFFQIQPAIAGYGGLGLGLFISKDIVERHGGKMWFESELGKGSTFYFTLPLG